MRNLVLVLAGFLGGVLFIAPAAPAPPKKKAPVKTAPKATAPSTKKQAASGKKGTATPARSSYNARRGGASYAKGRQTGRGPQPVPARRRSYGQASPSGERFTEIQQALISRGYLASTPSGNWDAPTVDAMKRFQQDQNLPPTGKITSLSLIALGLGPKRNQTSAASLSTVPTP